MATEFIDEVIQQEGRNAHAQGLKISENPYPSGYGDAQAWARGWRIAQDEQRVAELDEQAADAEGVDLTDTDPL